VTFNFIFRQLDTSLFAVLQVNFANYRTLLFPIHVGGDHWALVAVDMQHKLITYFCSLGGSNMRAMQVTQAD